MLPDHPALADLPRLYALAPLLRTTRTPGALSSGAAKDPTDVPAPVRLEVVDWLAKLPRVLAEWLVWTGYVGAPPKDVPTLCRQLAAARGWLTDEGRDHLDQALDQVHAYALTLVGERLPVPHYHAACGGSIIDVYLPIQLAICQGCGEAWQLGPAVEYLARVQAGLTVVQVARLVGRSPKTVEKAVAQGKLQHIPGTAHPRLYDAAAAQKLW